MTISHSTAYGWLMLAGIFVSIAFWSRLAKRDSRLVLIYIAALAGAFLGAKLVYLGAEGWLHWHDENRWLVLATGKSIIGGLLGGYAGVEIAKHLLGYRGVTGDWFAVIVPVAIMLGRVGCVLHGCCLGRVCEASWFTMNDAAGVARWPAAEVEFIFNALMLGVILLMRFKKSEPTRWGERPREPMQQTGAADVRLAGTLAPPRQNYILPGQHFHIYLMAYGLFRFAHEFLRETPQIVGPVSGYQIAALGVAGLGLWGFVRRRNYLLKHPVAGV